MSGRATAEIQAIVEALRRIVQALRVTARTAERRHAISAAQIFVLHLLEQQGPASVNELAERSFTHQSSVSVVVARLAAAGLVARQQSAEDRRRAVVAIAPRGRSLLRRIPEPAQARLFAALARIRPAERRALANGLAVLVREMGIDEGTAGMFFEERSARRPARARR